MNKIDREKEFHNKAFGDGTRRTTQKYYSIAQNSRKFYTDRLIEHGTGKKVLEYGCGPGSSAFLLAKTDADVRGIDISEVAIECANKVELDKKLGVTFQVMDAEQLQFDDIAFDMICGTGILHHLQLDKAYAEIARTLKSGGKAVFLEPLGHNFFINLYRNRTPELRTYDEHPLLMSDLNLARKYFDIVETRYFHLFSLGAILFRNSSVFPTVLNFLESADRMIFSLIPVFRKYAWAVVIVFGKK